MSLLTDWKTPYEKRTRHNPVPSINMRSWQAPLQNWVKVNVDAATFADIKIIGIRGVI